MKKTVKLVTKLCVLTFFFFLRKRENIASGSSNRILFKPDAINMIDTESESKVAQSCLTLCDPVDSSPPGSSIHGILQARILDAKMVAISFSRGSSRPRD